MDNRRNRRRECVAGQFVESGAGPVDLPAGKLILQAGDNRAHCRAAHRHKHRVAAERLPELNAELNDSVHLLPFRASANAVPHSCKSAFFAKSRSHRSNAA